MNSKDEKLDLKAKKKAEKGPWSSLVLGRPSDRASSAENGHKMQSKSLAENDPIYIQDPSTVQMKTVKSKSHQVTTCGNIRTNHSSDGSMHLFLIVPPHHHLREQL